VVSASEQFFPAASMHMASDVHTHWSPLHHAFVHMAVEEHATSSPGRLQADGALFAHDAHAPPPFRCL